MKPSRYGPFPYSPIIHRPPLQWPNGAHVALWVIPNIEFFALDEKVPPGSGGTGVPVPDVPTWSSRDYGNRVGVFRLMEVLDRHGIRATVALNSELCAEHPAIIEEGNKRRWEWMGHCESNTRRLNAAARRGAAHHQECARRPSSARPARGRAAGSAPACRRPGIRSICLAAEGCDYVCDWTNDDQPYIMSLDGGEDAGQRALQPRDQRQAGLREIQPDGRSIPRHDLPAVRRALSRGRAIGPRDGDCDPSLSHRRAAPHRRFRKVISLGGPKDITRIYVERMLAPSGVNPGDFDMVFAGATTARASALLAGAVDAAILLPPFDFQAVAKGFKSLGLTIDYREGSAVLRNRGQYARGLTPTRRRWRKCCGRKLRASPGSRMSKIAQARCAFSRSASSMNEDDVYKAYKFLPRRRITSSRLARFREANSTRSPSDGEPAICPARSTSTSLLPGVTQMTD